MEKNTKNQSASIELNRVRNQMRTNSNIRHICRRCDITTYAALVKQLLYPPNQMSEKS